MPGRTHTSPYTKDMNMDMKFRILDILNLAVDDMTIPEIQKQSMSLANVSPQKMSHLLSDLIDAGLVEKHKSNQKKRMVYAAVCSKGVMPQSAGELEEVLY